jgi:hypothetical protein
MELAQDCPVVHFIVSGVTLLACEAVLRNVALGPVAIVTGGG